MRTPRRVCLALVAALAALAANATSAPFPPQQRGATGRIVRMIVNHNANNDEVFISTDDPVPPCPTMALRTNDPNVSSMSYKTLYSSLLASKLTSRTLEFYTDLSCNLFRVEILG